MKLKNIWKIKKDEKIYRPNGDTYQEWRVTRPVFDSRNWKQNTDSNRVEGMPIAIEMERVGLDQGKHIMTKIEPDEYDQVYAEGDPEPDEQKEEPSKSEKKASGTKKAKTGTGKK